MIVLDVFLYDYWEEVYLIFGWFVNGCDVNGEGGMEFVVFFYVCCLLGILYGFFMLMDGCIFFEI